MYVPDSIVSGSKCDNYIISDVRIIQVNIYNLKVLALIPLVIPSMY